MFCKQVGRKRNLVGFEDETSTIIRYLREETGFLDVITLVGMPGIGKTTLAWKIFNDEAIQYEFPTRIWARVSSESRKNVWSSILRQLEMDNKDVKDKDDEELSKAVASHLKGGKYLIVLDDVWSVSDWDSLRMALPEDNKMIKVLITTCNEAVGRYANRNREPHKLRLMTQSESWELLQLAVFGETYNCPPELENVGKLICRECDGLPVAIVAMGGVDRNEDK